MVLLSASLCRCPRAWPVSRHECYGVDKCDNRCRWTSGAYPDTKPLGQEKLGRGLEGEVWSEKIAESSHFGPWWIYGGTRLSLVGKNYMQMLVIVEMQSPSDGFCLSLCIVDQVGLLWSPLLPRIYWAAQQRGNSGWTRQNSSRNLMRSQ